MTAPKVFFNINIRLLRDRKKMSQEDLSLKLDLSRNKLQALESGKTVNPSVADLVKFSEYFKISVDSLLKIDLPKLGELKLKELEAGNDVFMTGSKLRVLAITVDKNNQENVEYVPVKAKAGYRSGYGDPEFIASLPKFSLPNLPASGTFRMFPTTGNSMLPIPENSDVIAQYVQDWKSLKPDTLCIVILKEEQDFVFKSVTVQEDGKILLKSWNDKYQPYLVGSDEVLEIWKYYKHQTDKMPQKRTDMQELKELLLDVRERIGLK
ncbi:MAG: helix-turn-helix domain-containing protein [Daejeonella sp.]